MDVNRSEKPARAMLPSVLDLSEADDLIATLKELSASGEAFALDGSSVTRVSTPCLQVLMSAFKSNRDATLVGPSMSLLETIEDLGLSSYFEERIVLE